MSNKYFVISDIHSFFSPMIKALKEAGYNKDDSHHYLIVCGDIFDRGNESSEVYSFLKSIPKERCILIRGNHEQLYLELLEKDYPSFTDFSNGTVRTFCSIAGYSDNTIWELRMGCLPIKFSTFTTTSTPDSHCLKLWDSIKKKVKKSEITQWLKSDRWINYYELDQYIFVHAFIPLLYTRTDGVKEEYCIYYGWADCFNEREDWRQATNEEWAVASWGCPYKFFDAGLFNQEKIKGKILVCGHFACSEFNRHYLGKTSPDIYKGENLIAIDTTTALTDRVNVLIIEK